MFIAPLVHFEKGIAGMLQNTSPLAILLKRQQLNRAVGFYSYEILLPR